MGRERRWRRREEEGDGSLRSATRDERESDMLSTIWARVLAGISGGAGGLEEQPGDERTR